MACLILFAPYYLCNIYLFAQKKYVVWKKYVSCIFFTIVICCHFSKVLEGFIIACVYNDWKLIYNPIINMQISYNVIPFLSLIKFAHDGLSVEIKNDLDVGN